MSDDDYPAEGADTPPIASEFQSVPADFYSQHQQGFVDTLTSVQTKDLTLTPPRRVAVFLYAGNGADIPCVLLRYDPAEWRYSPFHDKVRVGETPYQAVLRVTWEQTRHLIIPFTNLTFNQLSDVRVVGDVIAVVISVRYDPNIDADYQRAGRMQRYQARHRDNASAAQTARPSQPVQLRWVSIGTELREFDADELVFGDRFLEWLVHDALYMNQAD